MLMIAYGASVGGLTTPIGSPPNLIGLGFIERQTGTKISFFEWVAIALPIVIVMFVFLCVILVAAQPPGGPADLRGQGVRGRGAFAAGPVVPR